MQTRVDHVDLRTPDLEKTVDFLEKMAMHVVRRTGDGRKSVEMSFPGPDQVVFEIREDEAAAKVTVDHIAFSTADMDQSILDARNNGIAVQEEKKYISATGRLISNVQDSHGTRWQLVESGGER